MNTQFRNLSVAVAMLVGASAFVPMQAQAKASFMADCSAKYKAGKADGSVTADTKWTDYVKTVCSANTAAAPTATPVAVAPVAVKKTKTPAPQPISTSESFMANCSAAWKQMKTAGTVPAGLTWRNFVKQQCVVSPADTTAVDNTVPAEPTTAASLDNIDVKTVDKNGKPFTAGQMAAHKRAKACGMEWRADKTAGTLPAGIKWPQFWSACNTRLKSQG